MTKTRVTLLVIGSVIILAVAGITTWWLFMGEDDCSLGDNVAVIKIYGVVMSYKMVSDSLGSSLEENDDVVSSEEIVGYLEEIEKDKDIKGIIVEVDSPGGGPVGAEEIMLALKKSSKPVAVVIRELGLSAGYLISTGADMIFSSKFSDVGSIGVTQSYLDYSEKNKKEGLIYQQISSGEFKDTGDSDKPLSEKEKELLLRDIKKVHQIFIEYVAENRKLDIKAVEKLADGSSILGQDAKAAGLIDEIGDLSSAKAWISSQLEGIESETCAYN